MLSQVIIDYLLGIYHRKLLQLTTQEQDAILYSIVYLRQKLKRQKRGAK